MSIIASKPQKPLRDRAAATRKPKELAAAAHALVRVRAEDGMTISAHRSVINSHGKVLFAKIGKGLFPNLIELLNDQIAKSIPTFLFIATYDGWKEPFAIYKCELKSIQLNIVDGNTELIPPYMHGLINTVGTWFEILSIKRVAKEEVKRLLVFTSGREVGGALRGATSMFKVKVSGDKEIQTMADLPPKLKPLREIDDEEYTGLIDDDSDDVNNIMGWS